MIHAGFPIYRHEELTICAQQEWTKLSVDIENTAASIIELEAQVYEQLCGMVCLYTRFNINQPVLPIGLSLNTERVFSFQGPRAIKWHHTELSRIRSIGCPILLRKVGNRQ